MDLDKKALDFKEKRIPFCWATVVKSEGSAPRQAGAKMIVTPEGSFGTVGGGGLEHEVIEDARKAIRRRISELKQYSLTEDGIQPCGGRVEIFLEVATPPKRAVVFGAGHVAEKLCPMLSELGFDITLVDERADRIELPGGVEDRVNKEPSDVLPSMEYGDDLHIISITHKHTHDEEIVRFCLDKPFKYLGLISSRKKWAFFKNHYIEHGFTEDQMSRVSTPIGLDIGAETPFEIAVAIAAQIIQLDAKPEDFSKGIAHFANDQ